MRLGRKYVEVGKLLLPELFIFALMTNLLNAGAAVHSMPLRSARILKPVGWKHTAFIGGSDYVLQSSPLKSTYYFIEYLDFDDIIAHVQFPLDPCAN
jgi:hypothetical protein